MLRSGPAVSLPVAGAISRCFGCLTIFSLPHRYGAHHLSEATFQGEFVGRPRQSLVRLRPSPLQPIRCATAKMRSPLWSNWSRDDLQACDPSHHLADGQPGRADPPTRGAHRGGGRQATAAVADIGVGASVRLSGRQRGAARHIDLSPPVWSSSTPATLLHDDVVDESQLRRGLRLRQRDFRQQGVRAGRRLPVRPAPFS